MAWLWPDEAEDGDGAKPGCSDEGRGLMSVKPWAIRIPKQMVVTSSAFPLFARNLGTKEPIATGTHMIVQKNTLLFGGASPSKVTVHVMP